MENRLSSATLTDLDIAGNATKKIQCIEFCGIEATSKPHASAMTHFHTDIWSSDLTEFKVKLVDFGANGASDMAMTWSMKLQFQQKKPG
jgi:hypothetical protein